MSWRAPHLPHEVYARRRNPKPWQIPVDESWKAAHPEFHRRQSTLSYSADLELTLSAANEFHSGRAKFTRHLSQWVCTSADSPLKFLLRLDPVSAKMDLIRRGFSWQWEEKSDKSVPSEGLPNASSNPETSSPANQRARPQGTSKASVPLDLPAGRELDPVGAAINRPSDYIETPNGKLSQTSAIAPAHRTVPTAG
jgi:hypothetical protein